MLKYAQALKAIMNTTKDNLQAYLNQLTQLQQMVERNNNGEQQHIRYHPHVVRNTLWMCTADDKHTTNMETNFIKADEAGTIDKLFRDIQEEFINAEIKIEDKKSLYPQQGQRGTARHHGNNNNNNTNNSVLLTQQ
eukprot:Pgem_evm1s4263